MASETSQRDMYVEATNDLADHIGTKVVTILRSPENQARIQSVLDPIISHIINRIFPYILLSAILFLILLLLTFGTFWMALRAAGSGGGGGATSLVA
jgi:hypothetical protein